MHLPTIPQVVQGVGTVFCALGAFLAVRVARVRFAGLDPDARVELGVASVSAIAWYKLMAFLALVVLPAGAVGVANYHVFEGVKTAESCAKCHVMQPMLTDMRDPTSDSLAARHYRNRWIESKQCYRCHADYGLAGTLEAKADGFRHLARYTTGTYEEPIRYRGAYSNGSCLTCHRKTPRFGAVASHGTIRDRLEASTMSCLNCHGRAHPSRAARTPGSPEYSGLMAGGVR